MIHDVIVVGSGPGGALAAATIAQAGKSVLLVDRSPFPRDKICGDGLPGSVRKLLLEQGIDPDRAGLVAQRIYGINMVAPSGRSLVIRERPSPTYSMVSPRLHFDAMLHQHALKQGAHFELMEVDGPLLNKDGLTCGVIERKGKTTIEHEARVVIAADGASSALARAVRGRVSEPRETALAIRAYATLHRPLPDDPMVYFKYLPELVPGYAWLFPTGKDTVNIGLGLFDQQAYKRLGKSLRQLLDEFTATLQAEYGITVDPHTVKSWPIPVWTNKESRVCRGTFLVGDAGRFVDALTGGGILPAMATGQLAGQAALQIVGGVAPTEAAATYDQAWRNGIGRSLQRLALVQRWIGSQPPVFNGLFRLADALPMVRSRLLSGLAGQHA